MAKAKLEQKLDYMDVPVVVISKPKGAISRMEAYELMEKAGLFGHYIFPMNISEEVPEDVYDEGDRWELWGEVYTKQFKYCPNCKARMIESQESEE